MDETTPPQSDATPEPVDRPIDTTSDPGPTEHEMPDPKAVQERVESGQERQSAEQAFGGAVEGEPPSR